MHKSLQNDINMHNFTYGVNGFQADINSCIITYRLLLYPEVIVYAYFYISCHICHILANTTKISICYICFDMISVFLSVQRVEQCVSFKRLQHIFFSFPIILFSSLGTSTFPVNKKNLHRQGCKNFSSILRKISKFSFLVY